MKSDRAVGSLLGILLGLAMIALGLTLCNARARAAPLSATPPIFREASKFRIVNSSGVAANYSVVFYVSDPQMVVHTETGVVPASSRVNIDVGLISQIPTPWTGVAKLDADKPFTAGSLDTEYWVRAAVLGLTLHNVSDVAVAVSARCLDAQGTVAHASTINLIPDGSLYIGQASLGCPSQTVDHEFASPGPLERYYTKLLPLVIK